MTRIYRGVTLHVISEIIDRVTVETITFALGGERQVRVGSYGNAQRAAEQAISRAMGITQCPNCGDDTIPEMPICSSCYAGEYGSQRFGGEVPAGVDW